MHFDSVEDFERWVEDLVAGKIEPPNYHDIRHASREDAEECLRLQQEEARKLGLDPEEVVLLQDPFSGEWLVLVPWKQIEAGLAQFW
jgi:hypothetical protein